MIKTIFNYILIFIIWCLITTGLFTFHWIAGTLFIIATILGLIND